MKHLVSALFLFLAVLVAPAQDVHHNASHRSDCVESGGITARAAGSVGRERISWHAMPTDTAATPGFLPSGEVVIEFPSLRTAEVFTRRADTLAGTVMTHVVSGGLDMTSEMLACGLRRVLAIRITAAEGSRPLNFRVTMADDKGKPATASWRTLTNVQADTAACSETMLRVTTDAEGAAVADRDGIRVVDATEATLYLVCDTRPALRSGSYAKADRTAARLHRDLGLRLRRAMLRPFPVLKSKHAAHSGQKD
ncbi:MAG: glycoside hydrolase N-terminal domain-containing protein [Bacteroidaceae bacterium]|nr:glycoside hydrolase N-terminal domain-containing protein [Bacteroidaceae bacterium]